VSRPRFVLATRNAHKVDELRRILAELELDAELLTASDFPHVADVAETGTTFVENATLKARAVADATGIPAVADDSGLTVDVLGGMPGVFSARWAGRHGDDRANLELLLAQLHDVPDDRRSGAFVCAAVLATPASDGGGAVIAVEGQWPGRIEREPRGTNGFGYDPIFVPDGESRTSAELSPAEKDALSHRGRAFRLLAPHLVAALQAAG
jgi:XTP/dITP diphosphohydrolase